jgi:hypothetical protein
LCRSAAPVHTPNCKDLRCGPVRVYCPECRHDYLYAFSCKARYFCANCQQKRLLAYEDCVEEKILARVPHRRPSHGHVAGARAYRHRRIAPPRRLWNRQNAGVGQKVLR